MKTILTVILVVVAFAVAAFFGLPLLIDHQNASIKTEMKKLDARVQKAEGFIKTEEEARKYLQLPQDADTQKIIRIMNAISVKLASIETGVGGKLVTINEEIKAQKAATEAALKKQSDALEKVAAQTREDLRNSQYKALLAGIRGDILKAKVDLVAKNIGNAKTELDGVAILLEKAKSKASVESGKTIEELQRSLKKAKAELDTDVPAALNRIDLIWHEISSLIKEKT